MTPSNRDEVNGVFESAQHLLVAYRDSLDNDEAEWSRREAVVVAAEHVYRRVRKRSFPCVSADDEAYRRLDGSLADIYARVGRGQEAQELLLPQDFPVDGSSTLDDVDKSAHDNPVATTIRMKTFAKDEAAEKATQLLLQQFHNNPASEAMPNLFTFATAMNAWAESTRPDAFDQAFVNGVLPMHQRFWLQFKRLRRSLRNDLVAFCFVLEVAMEFLRSVSHARLGYHHIALDYCDDCDQCL
jgi:hypothetical protein